nr:MAG TPA: hypothetical protein [Caudoviricetes sp.]
MKYEISKNPSKTVDIHSLIIHLPICDYDGLPSCVLDVEGNLHFEVEIDTGKIVGWDFPGRAYMIAEAADVGEYILTCDDGEKGNIEVVSILDYPPPFFTSRNEDGLCFIPEYFCMTVGVDGVIENWNPNLDCFFNEAEY